MATNRMKMLFSDAPPGAFEKLLSPRRKLFYGLFAFGPGTVLGLYLYSVKRRMERENEAMRMEHVQGELDVVQEQQNKDLVLASAIQEMRDRLKQLEAEAAASRQNAASVAKAAESAAEKKTEAKPRASLDESKIEEAISMLKQPKEAPKTESPAWSPTEGGVQGRAQQRQKDRIKEDVAAYQAQQRAKHGN